MVRLLVCDDSQAFATLVRHWVTDTADLEVVGITANIADVLSEAEVLQPDVIVIDHLLGQDTSDGLAEVLRSRAPGARVLLVSGMPADSLAAAAEACGADGHLSKSASATEFCDAIRAIAAAGDAG